MADPISDMLVRIRNAQAVQKRTAAVPYSNLKNEIVSVLKEAGFVGDIVKRGRRTHRVLDIALLYDKDGNAFVHGFRRVSKQSQRVYKRARDLYPSRKGARGLFVVSTSRGVLSSAAARTAKLGGEVLCEVW